MQLQIEDDMLEAELRPERSYDASVEDQLTAIDNDIWDRQDVYGNKVVGRGTSRLLPVVISAATRK